VGNYIRVDLKVIEVHAPMVARATGTSEDLVLAGLVRLWHRCWSTKTDTVGHRELAGAFGPEHVEALCGALVGQFLDVVEGASHTYRVKGAGEYIRIKDARAEGARITNARKRSKSVRERVGSVEGAHAGESLPSALIPNTEHRAPNVTTTTKEPTEQEASGAIGFWRFFMEIRQAETGRIPEAPPHPSKLGRWYSDAMMELGGSDSALREAIRGYGSDKYWREAGYPFAGFAKQWRKYAALDAVPKA